MDDTDQQSTDAVPAAAQGARKPVKPLQLEDWHFEIDFEKIAWATFDRAGESANALGRRPLEELGKIVETVEAGAADGSIAGLAILGGKPKSFIVGADINEFDSFDTEAKVKDAIKPVLSLLDRIEAMKVPVVVAFHGACVGGGLELALACHYRIATRDDTTRVGFPEVKLGIFPGFNGTARAIRQAGALAAMEHMLTGRMLRATAARAAGYIDRLVASPHELRWAARRAIQRNSKSKPAGRLKRLASTSFARGQIAKRMRAETAKKARKDHYPAPYRLIDLFETHGGSLDALKRHETEYFAPLMIGDTSRNLRRVFRLSEELKAQAPKGSAFEPLRVHVIGAGTMGADIAGWCVASGMQASLQDLSAEQVAKGIAAQDKTLKRKFRKKPAFEAAKARLIADPGGEHIGRADVVIEAIVENAEIKRKLFAEIEPKMKPGAVLATNTSSIMIEDLAPALQDPARLIGIHFFNPVAQMPLVEVIRGNDSRQADVENGCTFVTALGKFPLIVKSAPGFLVNRVLAPYMFEAMQHVARGEQKERIDEAAKAFGMPMGPIELADTVGLDVCAHVGGILGAAGGVDVEMKPLDERVSAGKLGKKSGEGFYAWKDGKPVTAPLANANDLESLGRALVEPLIAACEQCLADGIVESAELIDAGVIFGTGFAPFRGGPLHYRRNRSASEKSDAKAPITSPDAPATEAAE
jgi:3-hydroxyacyl-CoA dehydrogenase/enoyl-CoA hydratase/3-hydroxybutyryl-CoA epimerase